MCAGPWGLGSCDPTYCHLPASPGWVLAPATWDLDTRKAGGGVCLSWAGHGGSCPFEAGSPAASPWKMDMGELLLSPNPCTQGRWCDTLKVTCSPWVGVTGSGKKKPLTGFPAPSWVAHIRTSVPLLADPAVQDHMRTWVLSLGPGVPLGSWAHPASLLTPQREQDQK